MRRLMLIIFLAACRSEPTVPAPTGLPPLAPDSVRLQYPPGGAVIYAEALPLAGWASLPAFTLELVDPDETVIAQTTVNPSADTTWQVDLAHGYTGPPAEILIRAVPEQSPAATIYAVTTVILADLRYRPEGAFGRITFPPDGAQLGGDFIPVEGSASGVPNNAFTLTLTTADGTALDTRMVAFYNPNGIDEMPWTAELATNGYTGSAILTAYFTPPDGDNLITESIEIVITLAAG